MAAGWIEDVEALIRMGDARAARRRLRRVNRRQIDRRDLAEACSLATRAGLPERSILWLNPIVRSDKRLQKPATVRERAEYALALIRLGGQAEALGILDSLSPTSFPQILLFRAVALFSRWDYAEAVPLLERYLRFPLAEYQALVGRINLAAALIFVEKFAKAEKLLAESERLARKLNATLVLGNVFELRAQLAIGRGDYREAKSRLKQAASELRGGASIDSFLVEKWEAILGLKRAPGAEAAALLQAVRDRAAELRHWESVRDCDFHRAIGLKDHSLLLHVYHGTPFPEFRRRILEHAGKGFEVEPTYDWNLNGKRSSRILDLARGTWEGGPGLKTGQIPHRLLLALALDFYRPATTAGLFGAIFKDEYFHPVYSVARIHQALWRLREWLDSEGTGVTVAEISGSYQLGATAPVALRTTLSDEGGGGIFTWVDRLREAFGTSGFSSRDASSRLGVPLRSAIRSLSEASRAGSLMKEGQGRKIRYRLPAT